MRNDDDGEASGFSLVLARHGGGRAADFPVVVYLHDRGGDSDCAVRDARGLFGDGPDIVAPQAARPCNPFQSNLRSAPRYAGFSWYLGDDPSRPEAASFGDALAQLEFVAGETTRPFVLAGAGQGAVLAMTLALFAPVGLAGVHADGAALPRLDGWPLPLAMLPGVDFALTGLDAQARAGCASALAVRGATVLDGEGFSREQRVHWLQSLAVANKSSAHA